MAPSSVSMFNTFQKDVPVPRICASSKRDISRVVDAEQEERDDCREDPAGMVVERLAGLCKAELLPCSAARVSSRSSGWCSTMSGAKSGSFSTLLTAKRSASVWPGHSNSVAAQCTNTRLNALDGVQGGGCRQCSLIQSEVFAIPRTHMPRSARPPDPHRQPPGTRSPQISPCEPADAADDMNLVGRSFVSSG